MNPMSGFRFSALVLYTSFLPLKRIRHLQYLYGAFPGLFRHYWDVLRTQGIWFHTTEPDFIFSSVYVAIPAFLGNCWVLDDDYKKAGSEAGRL